MGTVAIFADYFAENYQISVIRACLGAIRARGDTALVLSGGELNRNGDLRTLGNEIYSLAGSRCSGGIVLGGSIASLTSATDVEEWFNSRFSFPLVSISAKFHNIPAVMVDNYGGMRMVVEHLVRTHRFRHFAYWRKQDGHEEDEARLAALRDVLEQVGTPLSDDRIVPAMYYNDLEGGVSWLLDHQGFVPGKDLEVLVCVDTWTLSNVTAVLARRGIQVPVDLAMASFDHLFEHSLSFEPTCAAQPLDLIARNAVDLLYQRMDGLEVPALVMIPPRFINGTSCGCPDPLRDLPGQPSEPGRGLPQLGEALQQALHLPGVEEADEEELQDMADPASEDRLPPDQDTDRLRALEVRFRNMGRLHLRLDGNDDCGPARMVIGKALHQAWEEILRLKIHISLQRRETDQRIRETLSYAHGGYDDESILGNFFGHVSYLGIPGAAVALRNPGESFPRLRGVLTEGNTTFHGPDGSPVEPGCLPCPGPILDGSDNFAVMPLEYDGGAYGLLAVVLSESFRDDYFVFETLRLVLGARVHGARLRRESDEVREAVRAAQDRMLKSEKYVLLGSLVAGMAHEVNNPLGVALTASEMLSQDIAAFFSILESGRVGMQQITDFRKELTEGVAMVRSACRKAADLMSGFKQLSVDQSSDRIRHFSFKSCLDDVLLSLRPRLKPTRIEVEVDIPPILELETRAGALSQILTNCIMNSLDHGFAKGAWGHISIKAAGEKGGSFVLEYRDDGRGIPEEELSRHFEPFFTTRRNEGGSGLGTHVIQNLVVNEFRGTIDLESRPGAGLRYRIEIPDNPGFRVLLP